jgi:acyl-CoA thioester hydrolase
MIPYFEFPHRVSGQEIDELGHAGNTQYVRWMQEAAVAHSSANGWPPERYQAYGSVWMVRSHQITYLKPAFEGDDIIIKTWVENMRRVTSLRIYEIRGEEGTILARAETDWVFVNVTRQMPTRIPPEVADCFVVVGAS